MELHEKIQELAKILRDSDLGEILVEEEGIRIRLRKSAPPKAREYVAMPQAMAPAPMPMPAAMPAASSASPSPAAVTAAASEEVGLVPFLSPMVGTFYRSSSPDREPFVQIGTRLKADTTLCIIEAMKVMNEIKAEREFEILDVLVKNGEPVEYGQPLFLIR